MKIAVVEDEGDIARLYADVLGDAGHEVWQADRYHLETVGDPDVVVIDLMMPDVDGNEVLEWLVANKPGVRRIVATAMFHVPDEIRNLADVVVAKPFRPGDLLAAL